MHLLLLAACANDVSYAPTSRELDSWSYVDAGVVGAGDRQGFVVPLFSQGRGVVRIFSIEVDDVSAPEGADAGAFFVRSTDWASPACDGNGDGEADCLDLDRYDDESDDDTLALPVVFAPTALGDYEGLLTVYSNDSRTTEHDTIPGTNGEQGSVWRVQLRGRAATPCARSTPAFFDFGPRNAGGEFGEDITIENCGAVKVVVSAVASGSAALAVSTPLPLYVLPGSSETVRLSWNVPAPTAGEPTPLAATVSFTSNAEDLDARTVEVIGNRCEASTDPDWDADGDGWAVCAGDCDDTDRTRNPSAPERPGTGEDEDCDGEVDEATNPVSTDDDGDGWTELDGDCDDADPTVSPDAVEAADGVDEDCDGTIDQGTDWFDDDGDGWSEREGDCDDTNRLVAPDRPETLDGVDNDCDGTLDEGSAVVDDDGDGWNEGEGDCDDLDPWVRPGGHEFCDGYDNDCDNHADEGEDDAPGGACAFLPERVQPTVDKAKGCSSSGAGAGALAALLAAAGLAARVRRGRPR